MGSPEKGWLWGFKFSLVSGVKLYFFAFLAEAAGAAFLACFLAGAGFFAAAAFLAGALAFLAAAGVGAFFGRAVLSEKKQKQKNRHVVL